MFPVSPKKMRTYNSAHSDRNPPALPQQQLLLLSPPPPPPNEKNAPADDDCGNSPWSWCAAMTSTALNPYPWLRAARSDNYYDFTSQPPPSRFFNMIISKIFATGDLAEG